MALAVKLNNEVWLNALNKCDQTEFGLSKST